MFSIKIRALLAAALLNVGMLLGDDGRLVLNIQMPPESVFASIKSAHNDPLAKFGSLAPDQAARRIHKGSFENRLVPTLSGIPALYGGYITYSNNDGQISFPLRHQADKAYLVITPEIEIIKSEGETVSHLALPNDADDEKLDEGTHQPTAAIPDGVAASIYSFELKKDENETLFWSVAEEEIPETRRLSQISVIILTRPSNLYVRTGEFMNYESESLTLPASVYAVGAHDNAKVLLNFAENRRYFEQLKVETSMDESITTTLITNE